MRSGCLWGTGVRGEGGDKGCSGITRLLKPFDILNMHTYYFDQPVNSFKLVLDYQFYYLPKWRTRPRVGIAGWLRVSKPFL